MKAALLRVVLLLMVLFTAVLLLIHAQPYDDHELPELLLPEGCPSPCFMGIRPGVTTLDEAMKLLQANGWVDPRSIKITVSKSYTNAAITDELSLIKWDWKDNANRFLISYPNDLDAAIYTQNNRVEKIEISIHFRLGEIYTHFGAPAIVEFATIRHVSGPWGIAIFHLYPQYGFAFQSDIQSCPYFSSLWMPEVRVEFSYMTRTTVYGTIGYRPSTELKHGVIRRLQLYCKL